MPAEAHVIAIERNCLVSSENLLFRAWVEIQPFLAPDTMSNKITLNVHTVREDAPAIIACIVYQAFLVKLKMLVVHAVISFIVPIVHPRPVFIMWGIMSLKKRRGSTMIIITRMGIIQPQWNEESSRCWQKSSICSRIHSRRDQA